MNRARDNGQTNNGQRSGKYVLIASYPETNGIMCAVSEFLCQRVLPSMRLHNLGAQAGWADNKKPEVSAVPDVELLKSVSILLDMDKIL
jgi:hypothetical protein